MSYTKTGQSITLNPVAFKKISYHSMRFLTDDVNGVLTGQINKDQITITNAYPLFHTRIMAPTLEIAFQLIETQLKDNEKIIGFYESLIKYEKNFVTEIGSKILDTIVVSLYKEEYEKEENQKDEEDEGEEQEEEKNEDELENESKIENMQIEQDQNQRLDLQIYSYQKKTNDYQLKNTNDSLTGALDYDKLFSDFEKGLHRKIIDFDHHFENCSLDFRNTYVVQ